MHEEIPLQNEIDPKEFLSIKMSIQRAVIDAVIDMDIQNRQDAILEWITKNSAGFRSIFERRYDEDPHFLDTCINDTQTVVSQIVEELKQK